jgi:hypothetical protein
MCRVLCDGRSARLDNGGIKKAIIPDLHFSQTGYGQLKQGLRRPSSTGIVLCGFRPGWRETAHRMNPVLLEATGRDVVFHSTRA